MGTEDVLILWGEAKPNFPVVDNPDDAHLQAQRAARVESARKFIMHLKALCASFECIDRDTCKVALPLASVDALKRARGYETFVAQVKAHRLDIAHLLWDERPREAVTMTTPLGQQMIDAAISPETLLARNVATMDVETED